MKLRRHRCNRGRREFFRQLVGMGAAALAGGATTRRTLAAPGAPGAPGRGRYRLTAHIRRYYERAGF